MGQLAAQLNEISIHALLAESDRKRCQSRPDSRNFYPRSPCGERQLTPITAPAKRHFYPRSPCGERPAAWAWDWYAGPISIHALLAESDQFIIFTSFVWFAFLSTLSLRRATVSLAEVAKYATFLSTLSLRRATDHLDDVRAAIGFLSTLSLRRATRNYILGVSIVSISIHALLAESDSALSDSGKQTAGFLSTLSLRRATRPGLTRYYTGRYFYPRSPCGERRPTHAADG